MGIENLSSILLPQPEYTLFNTLFYAIGFVISSYIFFSFLRFIRIKIDANLAVSFVPFILLGSCLRVLIDANVFYSVLLVTPLIYLTLGLFLSLTLFFSTFLQKKFKIPYSKITFLIGVLILSPFFTIAISKINNLLPFIFISILFSPWLISMKILKWKKENKAVFLTQIFDATVSFVGINFFGYEEMHVLPNILIQNFGPISFIFFKALIVFLILFILDKIKGDEESKNFVKLLIAVLGASTGTRDALRLILSV
ncbi:MAG: DUF63 family protein [Candidatus Aenigmatarchaeota archaeon]